MVPTTFFFLFLCAVLYLYWGIYILFKNRNSLVNRMFFSLCMQLTFWCLGYALMVIAKTQEEANIWRVVSSFGWCFFYSVWVDFAVLIRCESNAWMTNYKRLFYYVPALIFFIINLLADSKNVVVKNNGLWIDQYSQDYLTYLFDIYSVICMIIGITIIYNWGKKSNSRRKRKQSKIIVHSSITAYLIGSLIDTILPLFDIHIFSFDVIASLVVLPSIWYAISKYKMMYLTVEVANEYIMKTMNEPVFIVDQSLAIKYSNDAALEKTGYNAMEILGKPIFDLIMDIKGGEALYQNIFSNISNHEIMLITKNHECIPCLLSGAAILDNMKETIGTAYILYDITDRKNAERLLLNSHAELEKMVHERTSELEYINTLLEEEIKERQNAEESLKASEEQYKALINQYQDGILVCDSTTYIITHNIRCCQILGFDEEMFENRTIESILTPKFRYLYDEIQQVYNTNQELRGNLQFTQRDGVEHNIEYIFIPVSYNNQRNIMITFRDVTEKVVIEEHKRQMVNMESLGTLAGGIAHDFNNILAGIIGYTQLSLDEAGNGNNPYDNLTEILRLSERARKLIRQILTYSRKTNVKLENVDILPVIEEVVTLLNATKPSNVQINYKVYCDCPCVLADSTEVQELVMNLCVNSILAMKLGGGKLEIIIEKTFSPSKNGTRQLGEFIKLSIIDSGCGIDSAIKNRIFEPFFTTRGSQGGTGLGLSVVHGITQRYGGWINVDSEIGKGSTFTVFMPSIKSEVAEIEEDKNVALTTSDIKILLVDDEIPILDSIRRILKKRGYSVISISNPKDAYEVIKIDPSAIDIVITDQSMPEMSGNELIHKIFEIRPQMPVILSSGYGTQDNIIYRDGGKNIILLSKPASIDEYVKAIEHALTGENEE